MEEKQLSEFLKKFAQNRQSESEHEQFIKWIRTLSEEEFVKIQYRYEVLVKDQYSAPDDTLIARIESRLDQLDQLRPESAPKKMVLWPKRLGIAAACLLIAVTGLLFYKRNAITADGRQKTAEIKQGGNKAVLKLADGSQIVLDSVKLGILANQSGAKVVKTEAGQVSFRSAEAHVSNPDAHNLISIPRGGQYIVELPDGSKVWLNSASSLRFPAVFSDSQRLVELTGEAYFEVAKDKARPFIVKTASQSVEVLGTHFNVNAYIDEPEVTTTLMEGMVKLVELSSGKTQLLKPDQQARLAGGFRISQVDAETAIDWKNGNFRFSGDNIATIMRKVARWYDVDVKYQGIVTKEGFVGTVPRSKNIEEVLNTLKLTGLINYQINGKEITITP
jgi:transmembrane sensor